MKKLIRSSTKSCKSSDEYIVGTEINSAEFEAVGTIDVTDIETGEVYETFKDVWLGDYKEIYAEVEQKYNVVNIERLKHSLDRIIWVR